MKRREFITLIGGAAAAWPIAARAQQRVHVVGVLASRLLPPLQRFERKLREYGYIEGQNVRFVPRFAEGRDDRYPAMAAELEVPFGLAPSCDISAFLQWGRCRLRCCSLEALPHRRSRPRGLWRNNYSSSRSYAARPVKEMPRMACHRCRASAA